MSSLRQVSPLKCQSFDMSFLQYPFFRYVSRSVCHSFICQSFSMSVLQYVSLSICHSFDVSFLRRVTPSKSAQSKKKKNVPCHLFAVEVRSVKCLHLFFSAAAAFEVGVTPPVLAAFGKPQEPFCFLPGAEWTLVQTSLQRGIRRGSLWSTSERS